MEMRSMEAAKEQGAEERRIIHLRGHRPRKRRHSDYSGRMASNKRRMGKIRGQGGQ